MDLKVKISADATAAERGLAAFYRTGQKGAEAMGKELSNRMAAAFAAGSLLDGAKGFFRSIVNQVDAVKDLSDALELSTDEVQRLQVAADRAGVRFGNVESAVQRVQAAIAQAASGDKTANGIFAALGIDPTQGSSLDVLQRAVEAAGRGAREQGALFDLVGRKANALRNVVVELQQLGPVKILDQDAIKAVDDAHNSLKEIGRELYASVGPELGFWGRVAKRGNEIDRQSPGVFNFALTRAILGEMIPSFLGGSQGLAGIGTTDTTAVPGLDGSPLPIPLRGGAGSGAAPIPVPVPIQSSPGAAQASDALSRIGLFVGGRPEVQSLRSIERHTADTANALREVNRILRAIHELNQNPPV